MIDNTIAVPDVRFEQRGTDYFVGFADLAGIFAGIADYMSLWAQRYGIGMDDVEATLPAFNNPFILSFKVARKGDGGPISPRRYNTQLVGRYALRNRHWRMMRYLAHAGWLKRTMREVDNRVREWMHANDLTPDQLEAVSRWDDTGRVIIKFVDKRTEANSRRYETHRKYDQ